MADMFTAEEMTGFDVSYKKEMQPSLVSKDSFQSLTKSVEQWPYIVFDLETTGLSCIHHDIVGISLTTAGFPTFYIPIRHKLGDNLDPIDVLSWLLYVINSKISVAHNAKFDYNMLLMNCKRLGIVTAKEPKQLHCTMIMSHLLNSLVMARHGLKNLVKQHFNTEMLDIMQVMPEGENFSYVDVRDAVVYSCGDAFFTCKLFEKFKPLLKEQGLLEIYKIEAFCILAFAELDRTGICVDKSKVVSIIPQTRSLLEQLRLQIFNEAKREFNVDSPKDVSAVLFDEMKIPPPKGDPGEDGYFSTGKNILKDRKEFKICRLILEYREISKMLSSFLEKVNDIICEDGRIRTTFNQLGTKSGRASSSDGIGPGGSNPNLNLQQLPKDKSVDFRALLVPPKDYYWVAADFKQIEYRVMASLSAETSLLEAFANDVDFHIKTASEMLGKPIEAVTKQDRQLGKTINFAVSYGMAPVSLAKLLNISSAEAESLMKLYFSKLEKLSKFIIKSKKQAYENGFVRTAFGRIRDFSNIKNLTERSSIESLLRSAFNTIVQGTAADINKIAVGEIFKAKRKYGDKIQLALNVHDEVSLFVHNSIPIEEAIEVVKSMEQNFAGRGWCSYPVDIKYGSNYSDLKSPFKEKELVEEKEEEEIFSIEVVDKVSDAILVKTGQLADFSKLKPLFSPAIRYPFRIFIECGTGIFLLPNSFTCNPTKKILDCIAGIPGVESVKILEGAKDGIN